MKRSKPIAASPKASTQRRSSGRAPGPELWFSPLLAGAALALMVFVAYSPVLRAGFVWDDDYNLQLNSTLRSVDGLRQMWFVPQSIQQYYPLMYTSFWIEFRLWGFDPLGYHLVNIVLHALATILAWRLLLRLRVPGAWLAAAIFAVHPVEVESVAWVTERKNLLSLSFALASMLCYLRFSPLEESSSTATQEPRRWRWYVTAFILFFFALASKTAVVSMPPVLLVLYWWKRGRIGWSDVLPLLPFFALSVFAGVITVLMELYHVGAQGDEWSLTLMGRVLLAGRALWFYAGKLLWPDPLVFFYPRWDIRTDVWWQYLLPAAAVLLPVTLWLARHKIGRGPLAAVLIFGGVLAPVVGFVNVYYMQFAYVADHFQYHASIALIALAAAGATLAAQCLSPLGQRWAQGATAGLLVVLGTLTFQQTQIFNNLETLYSHTIAHNPRCWMAYINLMEYYDSQNRLDDAVGLLQTCLTRLDDEEVQGVYPATAHQGLGFLMMQTGRPLDARKHFTESLKAKPNDTKTLYGLGMSLATVAEWQAAQQQFEQALALNPDYADGLYGLGLAQAKQGQLVPAVQNLERATELNPTDPPTHFELANALAMQDKLREATGHYSTAIQLQPNYPDALYNLGVVELTLGDRQQAIDHFRAVLRLSPQNANAKAALDKALEETTAPKAAPTGSKRP